jgi:hypothetical protein|tara:strand:+ start:653 stop:826 length:174 start_codon:yes stop_codon:yes gene_type:complete
MIDKISSLIGSRRFWVAVGGVVFVVFDAVGLGLTHDQINHVVLLGGAWIVGDSLRAT